MSRAEQAAAALGFLSALGRGDEDAAQLLAATDDATLTAFGAALPAAQLELAREVRAACSRVLPRVVTCAHAQLSLSASLHARATACATRGGGGGETRSHGRLRLCGRRRRLAIAKLRCLSDTRSLRRIARLRPSCRLCGVRTGLGSLPYLSRARAGSPSSLESIVISKCCIRISPYDTEPFSVPMLLSLTKPSVTVNSH